MHGTVEFSNAPVMINLTGGEGIPGTPNLDWRIQGETGWLRLTTSSVALNVGSSDIKLEVYKAGSEAGTMLSLERDEWSQLPIPAQNIARLYNAYHNGNWYPDWEYALQRFETVETLWEDFDKQTIGWRYST